MTNENPFTPRDRSQSSVSPPRGWAGCDHGNDNRRKDQEEYAESKPMSAVKFWLWLIVLAGSVILSIVSPHAAPGCVFMAFIAGVKIAWLSE